MLDFLFYFFEGSAYVVAYIIGIFFVYNLLLALYLRMKQ